MKKEHNLVSIIIPTYNRAYLIRETLDSVMAQTYTNWECIVVDDGSTDDTSDIMSQYCSKDMRFQYHHRPKERLKGGTAARNYGFELSKGVLINWIDSDDILVPSHLMMHVESHFENNGSTITDCVVSNSKVFEETIQNLTRYWSNIKVKKNLITEMINSEVLWPIGCVTWKRKCIKKTPFNENLKSSQEWTFHLKQLLDNITYKIIDETTYLARRHSKRIGNVVSESTVNSTYLSRIIIFDELKKTKKLNRKREQIILQTISTSLQKSIEFNYLSSFKFISSGLIKRFYAFNYKTAILKIIFFASPFYKITGKGYRFFKINKKV